MSLFPDTRDFPKDLFELAQMKAMTDGALVNIIAYGKRETQIYKSARRELLNRTIGKVIVDSNRIRRRDHLPIEEAIRKACLMRTPDDPQKHYHLACSLHRKLNGRFGRRHKPTDQDKLIQTCIDYGTTPKDLPW